MFPKNGAVVFVDAQRSDPLGGIFNIADHFEHTVFIHVHERRFAEAPARGEFGGIGHHERKPVEEVALEIVGEQGGRPGAEDPAVLSGDDLFFSVAGNVARADVKGPVAIVECGLGNPDQLRQVIVHQCVVIIDRGDLVGAVGIKIIDEKATRISVHKRNLKVLGVEQFAIGVQIELQLFVLVGAIERDRGDKRIGGKSGFGKRAERAEIVGPVIERNTCGEVGRLNRHGAMGVAPEARLQFNVIAATHNRQCGIFDPVHADEACVQRFVEHPVHIDAARAELAGILRILGAVEHMGVAGRFHHPLIEVGVQSGILRRQQRHRARRRRAGHARAVEHHEIVGDHIARRLTERGALQRENIGAVRGNIGVRSVITVIRPVIIPIKRIDRKCPAIRRWIHRRGRIAISRRGHKNDPVGHREIDRFLQRLLPRPAAPAVVDDARAVFHRVHNRRDRIGGVAAAIAQKLQRHNTCVRIDPANAVVVIRLSGNRSRHMGSVRTALGLTVDRVAVVVIEIVTEHIVGIAVVIVIDSIARNFAGVLPHPVGDVLMGVVHPRIDDGHNDLIRWKLFSRRGLVPRFGPIHIGIDQPVGAGERPVVDQVNRLAGIVERKEFVQ